MILFITSLGTIIHKKLSVRLLNHTNTLSQLTINKNSNYEFMIKRTNKLNFDVVSINFMEYIFPLFGNYFPVK